MAKGKSAHKRKGDKARDLEEKGLQQRASRQEGLESLHQLVGNQAVQRLVAQRKGEGLTELDDETAGRINQERSSGRPLDTATQRQMGAELGHDFSDVRVHTSSEADDLNRQLSARAFTTGRDLYFRQGAYDPHSQAGQKLIAHELTHVVQQASGEVGGVRGNMAMTAPGDAFEQEADQVAADAVQLQPLEEEEEMLQAQVEEEEEEELLQPQPLEEEEEMLQAQPLEEEEEMLQAQPMEEEEEMLQAQVEEEEEEEPIQTKREQALVQRTPEIMEQLERTPRTREEIQDRRERLMAACEEVEPSQAPDLIRRLEAGEGDIGERFQRLATPVRRQALRILRQRAQAAGPPAGEAERQAPAEGAERQAPAEGEGGTATREEEGQAPTEGEAGAPAGEREEAAPEPQERHDAVIPFTPRNELRDLVDRRVGEFPLVGDIVMDAINEANDQGLTVGFGVSAEVGAVIGVGISTGVYFGPNRTFGEFAGIQGALGAMLSASVGPTITVVSGAPEDSLGGVAFGVVVSGGEVVCGSGAILFSTSGQTLGGAAGVSACVGSPFEIYMTLSATELDPEEDWATRRAREAQWELLGRPGAL